MTIYLDHNATTQMVPEAIDAVTRAMRELTGNPSSIHQAGQQARTAVDRARAAVARLIGGRSREILFTSGATESNQLAILGSQAAADSTGASGSFAIVTSRLEHPSLIGAVQEAEKRGATVYWLTPDPAGQLSPEELDRILEDAPEERVLVSAMLVQNEVGNHLPVLNLATVARKRGARFHTDATQAVGRMPVDVDDLGVDLLSASGHKFGGPRGVGVLFVRRGRPLEPLFHGGHQERGKRAGTENMTGIIGLGAAALAAPERFTDWERAFELASELGEALCSLDGARWLGDRESGTGNTCCVAFEGVPADELLMALDLHSICVSAGSACSSGSLEPSPVLLAMGISEELAGSAIRFSTGWSTTSREVKAVVDAVSKEVAHIRSVRHSAAQRRMDTR